MIGGYDTILDNLRSYSGVGLILVLLTASVVYLSIKFKNVSSKYAFVWYPAAVFLVYLCPLWVVYISKRNDSAILYRVLWLIPVGVIICAALVELIFSLPSKNRPVAVIMSLVIFMLSGRYVYANTQFLKSENIYHIPQDVIDICEIIETPGREVKACFPDELLQFVRQYSSYVYLAYGRDVFFEGFVKPDVLLRDLLQDENPDTQAIADELRNSYTPYLILRKDKVLNPSITEYEFKYVDSVGEYDIYLDERANISLEYR